MNTKLDQEILTVIVDEPGRSLQYLCGRFDLSLYRLKRAFRHLERELSGKALIHDSKKGVWIVDVDRGKCLGMEWVGTQAGGYVQCERGPDYPDGRCWRHSRSENPELTAFERRISYLVGPCEPTAYAVGQLSLTTVEELIANLWEIVPTTLNDRRRIRHLMKMLLSGQAFLKWKDMMRRRRTEPKLPPEFAGRHRQSSGNLFEFGLKQHFIVLETPPESSKEQVLKAWRRLARRYHPDTGEGDEEKMKAINQAKDRIFRIRRWD